MICEVTVFHFPGPFHPFCEQCTSAYPCELHNQVQVEVNETREPGVLTIHLDLMATVAIEAAGLSAEEVAVRAWIEAEGRRRREVLIALEFPTAVIEAQVDPLHPEHASCIRQAPTDLCGLVGSYQFIYDNGCESWLLNLSADWSPDDRRSPAPFGGSQRFSVVPIDIGGAVLRSLWTPSLN